MASNLESRLNQLISSIDSSQASEKEILQILQSNSDIDEFDIEVYINNITQYTEERETAMDEISGITKSLEQSAEYNAEEFEQQVKLLLLTEQRLQEIKRKLEILKVQNNNKKREIQITDYYRKYYRAWSSYMFLVFIVLFVNIIPAFLTFYGYTRLLINVIFGAVSIVILYLYASDLFRRDKRIFDEYDWHFDPNNVDVTTFTSSTQPEPSSAMISADATSCSVSKYNTNIAAVASSIEESGGIIQCPEGKIYDDKIYKCIPENSNIDDDIEGFESTNNFKTFLIE